MGSYRVNFSNGKFNFGRAEKSLQHWQSLHWQLQRFPRLGQSLQQLGAWRACHRFPGGFGLRLSAKGDASSPCRRLPEGLLADDWRPSLWKGKEWATTCINALYIVYAVKLIFCCEAPGGACPEDWIENPSGSCYGIFYGKNLNWFEARDLCLSTSSHLVVPNSEEELQYLYGLGKFGLAREIK